MTSATRLWAVAAAAEQAALAQGRVELAASEARVARLKHAAELEHVGQQAQATEIVAQIRADQEALKA